MTLPSKIKIVDLTARDGLDGFKHLVATTLHALEASDP